MTDAERATLAALAVGEEATLVTVAKCPHPAMEGARPIKDQFGWWWKTDTQAWPMDEPYGEVGDEISGHFSAGVVRQSVGGDPVEVITGRTLISRTLRITRQEVKRAGGLTERDQQDRRILLQEAKDGTLELSYYDWGEDDGDFIAYVRSAGHIFLTTFKRTQ